jgi:hypothetical protein
MMYQDGRLRVASQLEALQLAYAQTRSGWVAVVVPLVQWIPGTGCAVAAFQQRCQSTTSSV